MIGDNIIEYTIQCSDQYHSLLFEHLTDVPLPDWYVRIGPCDEVNRIRRHDH